MIYVTFGPMVYQPFILFFFWGDQWGFLLVPELLCSPFLNGEVSFFCWLYQKKRVQLFFLKWFGAWEKGVKGVLVLCKKSRGGGKPPPQNSTVAVLERGTTNTTVTFTIHRHHPSFSRVSPYDWIP